jgi:DNA-binding SARP family transcriptional activator/tetratricopeptide (TPR) repeat protein
MALELRLLGPLEVRRDGAPVRLPAKQRTLLAELVLGRGRVVSVDRLIESLWPDKRPADARHALEMHASRLRGLLGGEAAVDARAPGYALEVDNAQIDVNRFERLLAEARDLLDEDPSRAAARAGDALALWRGSALADFAYETFAQEEIGRLEELRLEAEDMRVEAELRLGRSAELIGEIEALAAAAPLRERRREHQMVALYRAGRQADALDVYTETRKLLDEELGLEPGPALRELQQAILRQDPALAVGTSALVESQLALRTVSVVSVEPDLALDLDPESHERSRRRVAEIVAGVAGQFDAGTPDELVLAFAHEDHVERAAVAADALRDVLDARIGVATGEALVGPGVVSGPLIERARRVAREGSAGDASTPLFRRADSPFVGRTEELERLRNIRAALVVGPPGIGKSRLAEELDGGLRVVSGRCPAFGAPTALPLRDIASQLGAAAELDRVPADEVPLTFRRLCERSAPLLVVVDDVQWASELVIEAVEQLIDRGAGDIRVLCLARDEVLDERPGLLPAAERIELGPLADADAAELATALGAAEPSLAERAEGNPLFIEQLLAHTAESKGPLPSSLQSLLVARLDRLPPIERLVVARAAVIGREFEGETVGHLLDGSSPRRALAALVRRGFLDLVLGGIAFDERFRFRHGLIHEAAYQSIPMAERARLHELVADLLDTSGAADELVGFHLEQAAVFRPDRDRHAQRLSEDAGRRLAAAGIARWKRQDAHGTVRLLDRAVQLLPADDVPRAELLCELASALNTSGDRERALELLEEARSSSDGRVRLRAELEHAAVSSLVDAEDLDHVLEVSTRAAPVFEGVGDDRSLGRAWMLAGWVRGGAFGRHEEWLDATERALACYRRAGWPVSTVIGHTAAALYLGRTKVGDGIERCRSLLEFEVADLASEASVYAHLGGLHAMACEFAAADDCLDRAGEIYTDLGRRPSLLSTWAPIAARSARLRGDLEGALETYAGACEELVAANAGFHLTTQAAELADLLCELERYDEAETWASLAEHHARRADREGSACTLMARAQLLAHSGSDDAEDRAREAVVLAEQTDELNLHAAARLALASVLERRDGDGAAAERTRAAAEYEAKGNVAAMQRVKLGTAATSPADTA